MGCGYRTGLFHDPSRPHWREEGSRPMGWSAWYPTSAEPDPAPPKHFFDLGPVAHNGPIDDTAKRPLVLLSHGTGGVTESLGWLARGLVEAGYIAIGVNHHGNSGAEPYMAEGFMCWWERARDLTVLLDHMANDSSFAHVIDVDRVATVGFSLGGYTSLALAGARTSMAEFSAWQASLPEPSRGPKEFADMIDELEGLQETSAIYRASMDRHGDDFSDARIKSVVAIAPAPPVRGFTEASLQTVSVPVTLIASGADKEAPKDQCADWLHKTNRTFELHDMGNDVGHYTFLGRPANRTLERKIDIFQDRPGVNRAAVHQDTISRVTQTLARDLA